MRSAIAPKRRVRVLLYSLRHEPLLWQLNATTGPFLTVATEARATGSSPWIERASDDLRPALADRVVAVQPSSRGPPHDPKLTVDSANLVPRSRHCRRRTEPPPGSKRCGALPLRRCDSAHVDRLERHIGSRKLCHLVAQFQGRSAVHDSDEIRHFRHLQHSHRQLLCRQSTAAPPMATLLNRARARLRNPSPQPTHGASRRCDAKRQRYRQRPENAAVASLEA